MIKKETSTAYDARLRGVLSPDLNISEIVQLAGQNLKRGLLTIFGEDGSAKMYFDGGNLVHASYGDITGIEALVETLSWKHGRFIFEVGLTTNDINIESDCNTALLNAVRLFDERNLSADADYSTKVPKTGEETFMASLNEQLEDFLKVDGVTTVVVVGRDGFVIDSASVGSFSIDDVGAVVSTGMGSSESIGADLRVGNMKQGMLEYENGIIFMRELGDDAIFVVVAQPTVNLGMIRLQIKRRVDHIRMALE
jgi:predicted regulator of Ras-like GTPase activity (Roadblock/LC7/MglB family)